MRQKHFNIDTYFDTNQECIIFAIKEKTKYVSLFFMLSCYTELLKYSRSLCYSLNLISPEDLLLETYLKLYENKSKWPNIEKEKLPWAKTVIKHIFLDLIDHESLRRHLNLEYINEDDELLEYPYPSAELTDSEILEDLIWDLVFSLPSGQYLVIDLMTSGYSEKEIAEILLIPEGTVKSRISTARKSLKNLIDDK